jgi:O-antigen/teichoic acid export membrane protein
MPARRLSRSTLWLLVSNLGSAVLAFLISVLIGRWLGERGLGVYSASLAWVYPLSILADAGLNTLLTREIARQSGQESALLRASLHIRWLIAGGLALCLFALAPLLSADATIISGIQLSAPLVFVLPTFGLYTAIFRARQQMWPIPLLNLGMLIAQAAPTAIVLARGGTIRDTFLINTLTSAAQLLAAWWLYRRYFLQHRDKGTTDLTAQAQRTQRKKELEPPSTNLELEAGSWKLVALLQQAYPFALAGVLAALQARLAILLLERGASPEAVGQFAAAARITEAGRMLPNALFGALLPVLAIGSDQLLLRRIYLGITAYGLALTVLIVLGATLILQLTYGESFLRGTLALQLSALALVPGLIRAVQTLAAYARGHESQVNRVILIGIVVQIAVALWLIPAQGAAGAAASLLVSEIVMVILLWHRTEQKT